MKRLLKGWNRKRNNKGMTLVELICTIAIMSIVGASVAGVMVVSARTYDRGSVDAELQEEAQLLANQIDSLVQNASDATSTDTELTITQASQGKVYTIALSGETVNYTVTTGTGSSATVSDTQPMADHVAKLMFDTSDFSESGVVRTYICIKKNDNTFAGNYTSSSRNLNADATLREGELTMTYTPEYVLEPNQSYPLTAQMSDGSSIDWAIAGNTDTENTYLQFDSDTGREMLFIGKDEKAEEISIIISSRTKRSDGVTPKVQNTATVYIRRVKQVDVTYVNTATNDTTKKTTAGTEYRITANAYGSNLTNMTPVPDMGYDSSYSDGAAVRAGLYNTINPKDVTWTIEYRKDGVALTDYSAYLQIVGYNESVIGGGTPYVDIKLLQDMGTGDQIFIVATSKHASGMVTNAAGDLETTNMTGIEYENVAGYWVLYTSVYNYYGSGIVRGSDDAQGSIYINNILALLRMKYGLDWVNSSGINSDNIYRAHRFREVTIDADGTKHYGMWTNWRYLGSSSQQDHGDSVNMRPDSTKSLDCDKTYEVQFRLFVKDSAGNTVWPFDDTPESEYTIDGIVNAVDIYMSSELFTNQLSYSGSVEAGKSYWMSLSTITSIKGDQDQKSLGFKVQKMDEDGNWVDVTTFSDYNNINADGVYLSVNGGSTSNINGIAFNHAGQYRVLVSHLNVPYTYYDPSDDTYKAGGTRSYQYYDETTNKGIYYFTCNENSAKWSEYFVEYIDEDGKTQIADAKQYFVYDGKLYKKSDFTCSSYWTGSCSALTYYNRTVIFHAEDGKTYEKYEYSYDSTSGELTIGGQIITKATMYNFGYSNAMLNVFKQICGWW